MTSRKKQEDETADVAETVESEEIAEEAEVETPTPVEPEPDATEARFGDRSSAVVRKVQERLGVKKTGNYDVPTMEAVAAWQARAGFSGGRGIWLNSAQLEKLLS